MTETEWLTGTGAQLRSIHEHASVRKMLLIAAAYVRRAEPWSPKEDVKRCDDILEAVADSPRSWAELEPELNARPGYSWQFTHILHSRDPVQVAKQLRKVVGFYPAGPANQYAIGLVHDVVGNPFRPVIVEPVWLSPTVRALAHGIYADRAFDRLPILADALQDAGCEHPDVLAHCRAPGPHVRGCWVVDLILNKE